MQGMAGCLVRCFQPLSHLSRPDVTMGLLFQKPNIGHLERLVPKWLLFGSVTSYSFLRYRRIRKNVPHATSKARQSEKSPPSAVVPYSEPLSSKRPAAGFSPSVPPLKL